MRSRAELRRIVEWMLRAVLVAGLAVALWRSLRPPTLTGLVRRTSARELAAALREVSVSARISELQIELDSIPDTRARAWIGAIRGAGVPVTWQGAPRPIAVEVVRTREPESHVRVAVVSDSGAAVAITDAAGAIDTLRAGARGASIETGTAVGEVRAAIGRFAATSAVPTPVAPRAVLVLGRAGWESRFVASALEESGWTVRSRQPVAPGVVIADADVLPIDTARYAAVVALDSTAADLAPALARFVAQGGGLVLAGAMPALSTLGALIPATTGTREPGRILLDGDSVTRADLPVRPLAAIRGDAVRLEGTPSGAAVAVRRAGLGRVLTIGYDETWRWRMLGGTSGAGDHRTWWSHIVGIVAPVTDARSAPMGDAAPLASLMEVLGPATRPVRGESADPQAPALPLLLLVLIVVLLLAETASRRFRGAR